MKNKVAVNHKFSQVPKADIQRSKFKRPSKHLTTLNSGYLVPIYCDEMLPGDTFNMNAAFFARMTTSCVLPSPSFLSGGETLLL